MATSNAELAGRPPASGLTTTREDFGGGEVTVRGETASEAVAAQARAQVEARYIMAIKRPRDVDDVRVRLLKECKRPSFAKVARYHKPVGKGVEGPSIRFAEAAVRCMTNISVESITVYDDPAKRLTRVCVTDLESNATYYKDVTIEKTVERSSVKDGQTVIGSRINSQNRKVYLVEATEDDLLNKANALESKAIRNLALRVLPGDILDECMATVVETLRVADAADPDGARKQIADAFSALGVMPSEIKEYLGHDLAMSSPAEMAELRAVYAAIKEGETTWPAAFEFKRGQAADGDEQSTARASSALKDKIAAKTREASQRAEAKPVVAVEPAADDMTAERMIEMFEGAESKKALEKIADEVYLKLPSSHPVRLNGSVADAWHAKQARFAAEKRGASFKG